MPTQSKLEKDLYQQFYLLHKAEGFPLPEMEYKFYPKRKWRADFAWPYDGLLCEVEGGVWTKGRHITGKGFTDDCEKYNTASIIGYRLIRVVNEHIYSGQALKWIIEALDHQPPDKIQNTYVQV